MFLFVYYEFNFVQLSVSMRIQVLFMFYKPVGLAYFWVEVHLYNLQLPLVGTEKQIVHIVQYI